MLTYCLASSLPSKPKLCENARGEAFELMLQHAAALGANALIGVRYDANDVTDGVTEVLAYGTAVVLEAVKPAPSAPVG